jgi:DNA-binding CsgD family transcriptional regulator
VDHADGLGTLERAGAHLSLAAAAFRAGHLVEARAACAVVTEAVRRTRSTALLAGLALTLEPVGEPTWDGDIHRWCVDALARPGHDHATRVRLLARQAQAAMYLGLQDDADRASAVALEQAERAGDSATLIEALTGRQLVRCGPDDVEELARLADRMVATAMAADRADAEMWGRLWRIDALWYRGSLSEIATETAGLGRCIDQVDGPYGRWHLSVTGAALAGARAEFATADRLMAQAVAVFGQIGHPAARGASTMLRLVLGHHRGYDDDLLAPDTWDFGTNARWDRFSRLARALVLGGSARREEAAVLYQRCGNPAGWDLPRAYLLVALAVGARVAAALGLREDVSVIGDALRPYRGRYVAGGAGGTNFLGPVELLLGVCAAARGDHDEARRALEVAATECRRIGAPGFAVEADALLASLVAAGDTTRARALARRVLPTARTLGMHPWVTRLSAVVARVEADPLSSREREVALLVAEGLSNRDIAERLVLSERTAQNHVQHILTKLGFVNRAQIAAWVSATRDE